jgi:hypothetical protein
MRYTTLTISTLLLLGGCIQDLLADGAALAPDTETDASSTSTGEPSLPTTSSAGSGVQTVTGDAESTETSGSTSAGTEPDPGSSSGEPVNLPPTVDLSVTPDHLGEAGPAELHLVASDDVVKVRLSLDGEKIADLTPANFPYAWEALSAKDNGPARTFSVVVEDEEGLTAEDEAKLSVGLPPPGAEKCLFQDPERGTVTSGIAALKYTPEAIVAVGMRGIGTALRLTVWKLDPNHCEVVLPGWPKTIKNWTGDQALGGLLSAGIAVDIDEDGNIVVAGNFIVNGQLQSYVALLNTDGARLWEKVGQPGDEVAGVGASKGSYSNRVFVVGSTRTSDNPVRTDGMVWVYQWTEGEDVYVQPPTVLRAPFTPDEPDLDPDNAHSEWARAVVVDSAGNALVVGEREYRDGDFKVYSRAFAVRVHPFGQVLGTPWTSWAPAYLHDAVQSVSACGDDYVAGGWTRNPVVPNSKPEPFLFRFATETHRHLPQLGATQVYGVACDREEKIVNAAIRSSGTSDAQVFTVVGVSDPPVWYEQGYADADGAVAVTCDRRGFCGTGGYRTTNAKPYAVVRVYHP